MTCGEDVAANRKRQAALLEQAAEQGAQIVCTQEMCTSQYFCQTEDHRFFALAESIPGPSTDLFCKIAKKHAVGPRKFTLRYLRGRVTQAAS